MLERAPPSNQYPPFDMKYFMSASLKLVPLFSRGAHLKNSI